jgi:hypothetical protein
MLKAKSGTYQEGPATIFVQGLYEESATKKQKLGTKRVLDDGRVYRYASITAAAIAAGLLVSKVQTPVASTIAAADAAINLVGEKEITLTTAGATANLYEDGWIVLSAGTGLGEMYKVRGNTATGNPSTGRASFQLYDALRTTHVTATTTVNLYQSPYKNLLINPAVADQDATTNETAMGATIMACGNATAVSYLWLQTSGVGALMLDVAAAGGNEAAEQLITPGVTAGYGAIRVPTEATFFAEMQHVGFTLEAIDLTNATGNLIRFTLE